VALVVAALLLFGYQIGHDLSAKFSREAASKAK
jgi:hypothetical protein